jgi:tellurite resistance protein TerC
VSLTQTHLWIIFGVIVTALVAFDLWHSRERKEMSVKSALHWSLLWIGISLAFGGLVWWVRGSDSAVEYVTGWMLEKALSIDNLFVFLLIFSHFRVPAEDRHRVLSWGIIGALVLRAVMIFAGIGLIQHWHAVIYVFGALLALTGLKTMFKKEGDQDLEKGRMVRMLRRILPLTPRYDGGKFFTLDSAGRRTGTMLLLVVMVVEMTDVLFAIDSIPAVFAVTEDPFIVFTSNMFAVLGLRALYFALAGLLERLEYLRYGLGAILILVGAKMCLSDVIEVPAVASLAMTLFVLAVSVVGSLLATRHKARREAREEALSRGP